MNIRIKLIDALRTLAIILMIFFHLGHDLTAFGFVQIDFKLDPFWFYLPRLIVTLFFLSAGASLYLAYAKVGINWKKFLKRQGQLLLFAILITIITYFLFPKTWIYFGTLHSIFICSFLTLPLINFPRTSFWLGILMLIPPIFFGWRYPWPMLNHFSMDYIPALPWVAVMWMGIYLGYWCALNQKLLSKLETKIPKFTNFMGKHSLIIYLVHQPILYFLVFLVSSLRQL